MISFLTEILDLIAAALALFAFSQCQNTSNWKFRPLRVVENERYSGAKCVDSQHGGCS